MNIRKIQSKAYLSILLLLLPLLASAHDFEVDGIFYQIISEEDRTIAVTYEGTNKYSPDSYYAGEIIIPEHVSYSGNEYTVTRIGERAFMNCDSLTSVSLPESIERIEDSAFSSCYDLTEIRMPSKANHIGTGAFNSCKKLDSIRIPEGVTILYYTTFWGCTNLKSVILPNSLLTLENGVFVDCDSLSTITLPDSIVKIGNYTFGYCDALDSITIPASVTDVGTEPFGNCNKLKFLQVAEGNPKYDSRDRCNAIIETATNKLVVGCAATTIPEGITTIGTYAFCGYFIPEIVLPASLETIEYMGIRECTFRSSLIIPEGVKRMDEYALYYNIVDSIIVHGQVSRIEKNTFDLCTHTEVIDLPESIEYIGDAVFDKCTSLNKLICRATTPPQCGSKIFKGINKNCTLEVPEESLSLYESTDGWKDFICIKAIGTADVVELPDSNRNIVKRGHGTYYTTEEGVCTYLFSYDFNTYTEILDSTEYIQWNRWSPIVIDVDTIGPNAFAGCSFDNGQVIYLTERVKVICKDAFSRINIRPRITADAQVTDNLTLVFEGNNPPSIADDKIIDYTNTSCHINFVVPNLESYIKSDYQWTYTQIMTIDDLLRGRVSSENRIYTFETTESDIVVDFDKLAPSGAPIMYASVRPGKKVPVRIGTDGDTIYSPAPAWQKYTMQVMVVNDEGSQYFGGEWKCGGNEQCDLTIELFRLPDSNYVYFVSRCLDDRGITPQWTRTRVELTPQESKPYLVTEGKQWAVCVTGTLLRPNQTTFTYRLQGDTIINSKRYLIEHESYDMHLNGWIPSGHYMREEDGKVYRKYGRKKETILLDYNMQVGDTLRYNDRTDGMGNIIDDYYTYVCLVGVRDTILPNGDGVLRRCYDAVIGEYAQGEYHSTNWEATFVEDIGWLDTGLSDEIFFTSGCGKELLYVKQDNTMLYQKEKGVYWIGNHVNWRPLTKRGYGLYHSDSYLYAYTLDEAAGVTDSTDFARWNDRTVIRIDVDTIGHNAFAGATFRQGQIICFTERLNTIFKDAFTGINILPRSSQEAAITDDLTLVFEGANPPGIDKNSIIDYSDSTYHINFVVPDIATYIAEDIQWTYTTLMTIEDLLRGQISPENEVTVSDSTEVQVNVDASEDNTNTNDLVVVVEARPRKDIPVRIGDGENKDIYSRAPAWQRYTMELKVTDSQETVLFEDAQECNAEEGCVFEVALSAYPEDGVVYLHTRSTDMFNRSTEWMVQKASLYRNGEEGYYFTDVNVNLDKHGAEEKLTATITGDSIRITGYYLSNCAGELTCEAYAKTDEIALIFYDEPLANCVGIHYVDFTIPLLTTPVEAIYVVASYDQSVLMEVEILPEGAVDKLVLSGKDAPYYDLTGRRVAHPTRGVYIRNGKKVIL